MPQPTIYDSNQKKTLQPKNTSKRKIFNLLKKHKNGLTQKKIVEELKLSQSTISEALKDLTINKYPYRNKVYEIDETDGIYILHDKTKVSCVIQKEDYEDDFTQKAESILNPKIWKNSYAQKITSTVVLFEINPYHRTKVSKILREFYGDDIYVILPCDTGLYIVVKEHRLQDVLNFYIKCYDNSKNTQ